MDNSVEDTKNFAKVSLHSLCDLEKQLLETMLRNAYLNGQIDANEKWISNVEDSEEEDGTGRDGLPLPHSNIKICDSVKAFIEDLEI